MNICSSLLPQLHAGANASSAASLSLKPNLSACTVLIASRSANLQRALIDAVHSWGAEVDVGPFSIPSAPDTNLAACNAEDYDDENNTHKSLSERSEEVTERLAREQRRKDSLKSLSRCGYFTTNQFAASFERVVVDALAKNKPCVLVLEYCQLRYVLTTPEAENIAKLAAGRTPMRLVFLVYGRTDEREHAREHVPANVFDINTFITKPVKPLTVHKMLESVVRSQLVSAATTTLGAPAMGKQDARGFGFGFGFGGGGGGGVAQHTQSTKVSKVSTTQAVDIKGSKHGAHAASESVGRVTRSQSKTRGTEVERLPRASMLSAIGIDTDTSPPTSVLPFVAHAHEGVLASAAAAAAAAAPVRVFTRPALLVEVRFSRCDVCLDTTRCHLHVIFNLSRAG